LHIELASKREVYKSEALEMDGMKLFTDFLLSAYRRTGYMHHPIGFEDRIWSEATLLRELTKSRNNSSFNSARLSSPAPSDWDN